MEMSADIIYEMFIWLTEIFTMLWNGHNYEIESQSYEVVNLNILIYELGLAMSK